MSKYLSQDMKDVEKDDAYYLLLGLSVLYAIKFDTDLPKDAYDITVDGALTTWNNWAERLKQMNVLAKPFNLEFYLMEESGHYYLTLDAPGQTAPATAEL